VSARWPPPYGTPGDFGSADGQVELRATAVVLFDGFLAIEEGHAT
jgi:hypothetical protein